MLNRVTLDQAIDTALQLPAEQQEMLVDIIEQVRTKVSGDGAGRIGIASFYAKITWRLSQTGEER